MNYNQYEMEGDSLLAEIFEELETGGTASPKKAAMPVKNRVRFLNCSSADHKKLEDAIQMSVPVANLRAAIADAADMAINWIYKAITTLRVSPRTVSTITNFRNSFAQAPDWQPPWKKKDMKWVDFGDLIATRLESAARILDGGWIKYNCIENDKFCPECKGVAKYWACSSFKGKYVICLGSAFWDAWRKRDFNSLALTLIHEALHIYFKTTVAHSGRSGNAYCYERYVLLANGEPVPAIVSGSCP